MVAVLRRRSDREAVGHQEGAIVDEAHAVVTADRGPRRAGGGIGTDADVVTVGATMVVEELARHDIAEPHRAVAIVDALPSTPSGP